jgi:hypothetical protein
VRMSEDKVLTKDSCWSVGMIYNPRGLPEVSTVGPKVDGVLHRPIKKGVGSDPDVTLK